MRCVFQMLCSYVDSVGARKNMKAEDVVDVAQKQWTYAPKNVQKLDELFRCHIDSVGVCCESEKIGSTCDESIVENFLFN